jgi:lysophospholipase L1-like esterase
MSKTTVLLDFGSGPSTVVLPATVYIRAVSIFTSGNKVILPAPAPVPLDSSGQGSVSLDDGVVWGFVVSVPSYKGTEEFRYVTASDEPVQYKDLLAVSAPPAGAPGVPEWVADVLAAVELTGEAAAAAGLSAQNAAQTLVEAQAVRDEIAAQMDSLIIADSEGKLPESAVPARLTETGLSATIAVAVQSVSVASALGILAGSVAARDERPIVIVGAGSSTTAGTAATTPERRYLNRMAAFMQAAYPLASGAVQPATRTLAQAVSSPPTAPGIQFVNAGVGSTRADTYLTSTTGPQVAALAPAAIFHMVGSNDFAFDVPLATYKSQIITRLDQLDNDNPSTRPTLHVLIHPYARYDAAGVGSGTLHTWAEYGGVLREIASERPGNVMFVNISQFYEAVGIPSTDPFGMMDADKVHQNDKGHAFMADLIRDALHIPAGGAPVAPVAPVTIVTTRLTSDTFATAGDLNGQSTTPTLGGVSQIWGGTTSATGWAVTAGGKLTSAGTTVVFARLAIPASDVQMAFDFETDITVAHTFILGTSGDPTGTYDRLAVTFDGTVNRKVEIVRRVAGTSTVLASLAGGASAAVIGKRWTIRRLANTLSLLVDGASVLTAAVDGFPLGGFVGLSKAGAGGSYDNLAVDTLTQQ